MAMCCRSSGFSGSRCMALRWCGSRTVRRGCPRVRSSVAGVGDRPVRVSGDARRSREEEPAPHGLSTRSPNRLGPCRLIRTPQTLPRVIDPDEADALLAALRKHRDRAMVQAMLLGGLRRCEVLGLEIRGGENGYSSPTARAGISGSCRCRRASSRVWPTTSRSNGRPPRRRIGCSSPSRARVAASRWGLAGLDEITSVEPGRPHPFARAK